MLVRDWAWASADAPSPPLGQLLGARQGPEPFCAPADPAGDMGLGVVLGSTVAPSSAAKFLPAACGGPFRLCSNWWCCRNMAQRVMLDSIVPVCGRLTGVSRSASDVTGEPVPWQRRGAGSAGVWG